jgi:hypothetical protein
MGNAELIKKADLAIGDLVSGGRLSIEQAATFVRTMLAQPTILQQARVVGMTSPQREINKIGFGQRILRPAQSATALAADQRAKPDLGKIVLNTKEVIAEVRLPYDVIEDNIERGSVNFAGGQSQPAAATGGITDTILSLIAERAALDLEELAVNGDTTNATDSYLALVDGWYKLISGTNIVDAAGAPISKSVFKAGMKALPDAYKRNLNAMRHYVSMDNEIEYMDSLANRNTALGDAKIQGLTSQYAYGVPVAGCANVGSTIGLLTNPLNLIMGIQRDISIEAEKLISERVVKFVLTARVDFKVEETNAAVAYSNIG